MPCDDWQANNNVIEFKDILNELSIVANSVGAVYMCIGGDFNTDLNKNTPQTVALNTFTMDNNLHFCANSDKSSISYTYCSKINNKKTFIDHFILSENLSCKIL